MPVIRCPHCGIGSDFHVEAMANHLTFPDVTCAIGFCRLCRGDVYFHLNKERREDVISSYPPLVEKAPDKLPPEVKQAFEEALKCRRAGAPNGALCMCRRAIDEALTEQGETQGDLPKKLNNLVIRNVITPSLRNWADHARIGGRIAAHGTGGKDWNDVSLSWATEKDADDVIKFCMSFFEYVYVLPEKDRERRAGLV